MIAYWTPQLMTVEALPFTQLRKFLWFLWFQQDGAPPHYAVVARATLDAMFGDNWIGRAGPIAWPPHSPDLTLMDFFLLGYTKSHIYETPANTPMDLQECITQACAQVTPNTVHAVQTSIQHHAVICVGADGWQLEHICPKNTCDLHIATCLLECVHVINPHLVDG